MELQGVRKELLLLKTRWYIILGCLCLQYVHGIFTQLAYRMHQPAAEPLRDLGFSLLPELAAEWRWLSEALFTGLFLSFILWTFLPLLLPRKFSCVVLWTRLLTVLVVCQSLRILSFTSTQLPGPAPHCRLGTPTAHRAPAEHWWQHVVVDVRRQVGHSCGDLIFSSHMTFILMGVLSYQHYGGSRVIKALAWAAAVVLALLIISARKHYTVDVVIAWYTAPLVYACLTMYWDRKQQQQLLLLQAGSAAAVGSREFHHPCCSSDSCSKGLCSSCERCSCSCACYSATKKLRLPTPSRSASPIKQTMTELSEVDGSAVITLSGAAVKAPACRSARTPTARDQYDGSSQGSPSWSRIAAVWELGHRAGSDSSSSGGSHSRDSWGLHAAGGSPARGTELV